MGLGAKGLSYTLKRGIEDGGQCRNLEVITRDRPTEEPTTLARVEKGKELESLVDELIKGMEELQLSFSKLEKIENLQSKKA